VNRDGARCIGGLAQFVYDANTHAAAG
jgi:hypothetical protein